MSKNQSNWEELKEKIKAKWEDFTDADLDQVDGNLDHLSELLKEKYGMTKEQAEKHIDEINF